MEKFMRSKYKGICAETGKSFKKGDPILFDTNKRKVYCNESKRYDDAMETESLSGYIQAAENEYFDNFFRRNNI